MPLSDAFGTRVERIRGESVKNSTPPDADLAQHVGVGAELVVGEDLDLDAAARSPA